MAGWTGRTSGDGVAVAGTLEARGAGEDMVERDVEEATVVMGAEEVITETGVEEAIMKDAAGDMVEAMDAVGATTEEAGIMTAVTMVEVDGVEADNGALVGPGIKGSRSNSRFVSYTCIYSTPHSSQNCAMLQRESKRDETDDHKSSR